MLFLLARAELLPLIVVSALLSGLAGTVFNVLWFTALQREVPAGELSRVSSWDHFGSYALQPVGLALVGPIAIAIGISTTLYLASGLAVLLTLAVVSVRAVRDFQLSPATAPEQPLDDRRAAVAAEEIYVDAVAQPNPELGRDRRSQ